MTYKINNSPLLLQPTKGRWLDRKILDYDGNNRAVYVPTYEYLLSWDIISYLEFKQLYDAWLNVVSAGTISVDLPEKGGSDYDVFATYTEVVPDEPTVKEHFQKHQTSAEWKLRNI